MCVNGGSPCDQRLNVGSNRNFCFSITAADNISASTLTPHGGRAGRNW
jgi:hypothetical protein